MSGVTVAEMVLEARCIVGNVAFHDDLTVLSACGVLEQYSGGVEAAKVQELKGEAARAGSE